MVIFPEPARDFAKEQIERLYDSDFFPKPAEFEALWHLCWPRQMAMVCGTVANTTAYRLAITFPSDPHFCGVCELFLMERGLLMPLDAKDDFNRARISCGAVRWTLR